MRTGGEENKQTWNAKDTKLPDKANEKTIKLKKKKARTEKTEQKRITI